MQHYLLLEKSEKKNEKYLEEYPKSLSVEFPNLRLWPSIRNFKSWIYDNQTLSCEKNKNIGLCFWYETKGPSHFWPTCRNSLDAKVTKLYFSK